MHTEIQSASRAQEAVSAVCPHLRLADDTATHCLFPTSQHVCMVEWNQARRLSIDVQSQRCLTSGHTQCAWYRPAAPQPISLHLGGLQSSPRPMRSRLPRKTLIAVALVVGAIGGGWLTVANLKPEPHNVTAEPRAARSSGAIPTVAPAPTFVLQPPPLSSVVSAAEAEEFGPPLPAPVPPVRGSFASGSPPASPEQTHVVADGESLWEIAQTYGVDLEELAARNELSTDAHLFADDTLVIPAH